MNVYKNSTDIRIIDWDEWMKKHHIRLKPVDEQNGYEKKEEK